MKDVSGYKLMFKGMLPGKHVFTFEVNDSFFALFEGSEIEHGKFSVEIELEKQAAVLQMEVKIAGFVKVACDRCLDEFELPVNYEGTLVVRFSKAPDETSADDEIMVIDPAEGEVDLSQFLFDSINISIPLQRVHPEGQCNKEMIEKLNVLKVE